MGLSFGEFVELTGLYLFADSLETDFSGFTGLRDSTLAGSLARLDPRAVDVERYGTELRVNLARGSLVPFLTGGTGLVRFSPTGLDATRSIYLTVGGGLQLVGGDRFALTVQGEALGYRYNPGTTLFTRGDLAEVGLGFGDFNQTGVVNLSGRAALQLYLGGRAPGELSDVDRAFLDQFSNGLGGVSLQVEPFYGRVRFDEAVALGDQTFVGGEAGVDFGPLIGVRGFYGRGVETDDPTRFEPIVMYGGDLRLRLASGNGLVPFLTLGGGYLDVLSDYDGGVAGRTPDDRPFALAGAGLALPLGDRLRLQAGVRGLVLSDRDEADVSRPEDVTVSPFYRAGLAFGLGGQSRRPVDVVTRAEAERERAEREARLADEFEAAYEARLAEDRRRIEAEYAERIREARLTGDSLAAARLAAERDAVAARMTPRRAAPGTPSLTVDGTGVARVLPSPVRTTTGERIVTIPLPETGELYVRYGDPGGVQIYSDPALDGSVAAGAAPAGAAPAPADAAAQARIEALERRIDALLRAQLDDARAGGLDPGEVDAVERRIREEVRNEIRALRDDLRDRRPETVVVPVAPAAPVAPVRPVEPAEAVEPAVAVPVRARSASGFVSAAPLVGLGFGRGGGKGVVGVRGDYRVGGPFGSDGSFRYLPAFGIGVGGERSYFVSLDAAFSTPSAVPSVEPYVGGGVGVVGFGGSDEPEFVGLPDEDPDAPPAFEPTLNLLVGANFTVGRGQMFAQFTTGNFAKYNRLTAGYRFVFGTGY